MNKLLLLPLFIPFFAYGQEEEGVDVAAERAGNYRTRDERREAGLGTELTDWLTFSGLVEVEHIREVNKFDGDLSDNYDFSTDPSVQAAFDISFLDIFEAELILEYTEDSRDPIMDELIIAADVGNMGFSAGRFYAPFGLYYSHFVTGPLLEFAETRRDILLIDYDILDVVELAAFAFDGESRKLGETKDDVGWGASIDALLIDGRLNVGAGYISNLAESDEEFLREEDNIFRRKVGAWNAYAVYEADTWDVSFEILSALDSFSELDLTEDRPKSWNLEAAYFPSNTFEVAFRYERSKELIDAPEEQYGVAFTWRLPNNISMTAEYLNSDYKKGFVEEDDDSFVRDGNTITLWIATEF
ncbi:MAG: hypothetical protein COB20_14170 [SAR86 cluster bacterium]|uniref:LbtU family siderophore porin n=1 Tax=SAR86 cluster bacterium TaxID=2030880 RepID=A0A2A4WX22_9GAMM|nr:MAG: hypothetical protein COB20_14170 [SAR86 cluster bacterium]